MNPISRILTIVITGALAMATGNVARSQSLNIKNDRFWNTKDGKPIFSQGGGIFRFKDPKTNQDKYYWYGVQYEESVRYRKDPSVTFTKGNRFDAVTCYTSTDLVHWESEGEALTRADAFTNGGPKGWPWIARLGVAHFKKANQYVMVAQYGAGLLFAVADHPAGPFKWHHRKDMTETIGTPNTGDQTVFTDDDTGKSYLVYSYGKGRNKIYISEIGFKGDHYDLLDCTEVYKGAGREGNCMFKYKGKYYLAASDLYGWDSSHAYYLVADDIRGPYRPRNDMRIMKGADDDYAHITQTGFFVTVKGTQLETVVYCGDRWAAFAGNGLGYNQWCPLSFEGDEPYFNSLNSWDFDEKSGRWRVAKDNNWVKNASFEADRRDMPNADKPRKESLMSWETTVIKGTKVSFDRGSPVLNHSNSSEDRKQVIGERCLNMSDNVDFIRKVHQQITSSPHVELANGDYVMTAKVWSSEGFGTLEIYALSGGNRCATRITGKNPNWATVRIDHVRVANHAVEIGFLAEGQAGAVCRVDDVSFVRSE